MVAILLLLSGLAASALAEPLTPFVTLNDGKQMPRVNLGTCCGSKPSVGLGPWLKAGGVGIDNAVVYHDSPAIAKVLASMGIDRSKVYLTSKITSGCGKASDCAADSSVSYNEVKMILSNLNTSYLDLILLHRPCQQAGLKCFVSPPKLNPACIGPPAFPPLTNPDAANNALWQGLEQAQKEGLVRSIGVSNYNAAELSALKGTVPAVNQCEMSIQGYDNATIQYCQSKGIVYESYSLMRGCPFSDPKLASIAKAHGKSAAQVCIRWNLQRTGMLASGTGANATTAGEYAKENLDVFDFSLSDSEVTALNDMQLPDAVCKSTEYCCPDAKKCLTPTSTSCAMDATACSAGQVCCPLTKICVTPGADCSSPCAGAYCCPDAKKCLTPSDPGKIVSGASDCAAPRIFCPLTKLCVYAAPASCVPP
jgi:diketogulonate reductase-like aldo/keto reductase